LIVVRFDYVRFDAARKPLLRCAAARIVESGAFRRGLPWVSSHQACDYEWKIRRARNFTNEIRGRTLKRKQTNIIS
jgi:hypothetical protein